MLSMQYMNTPNGIEVCQKKIDEKIVPILQLDDKTKEEEATAL